MGRAARPAPDRRPHGRRAGLVRGPGRCRRSRRGLVHRLCLLNRELAPPGRRGAVPPPVQRGDPPEPSAGTPRAQHSYPVHRPSGPAGAPAPGPTHGGGDRPDPGQHRADVHHRLQLRRSSRVGRRRPADHRRRHPQGYGADHRPAPLRPGDARAGPGDPHVGGVPGFELPALEAGLQRVGVQRHTVARLPA